MGHPKLGHLLEVGRSQQAIAYQVVDFRAAFEAKYGKTPDALAALAYDATNLMLQAISDVGADDPVKVREAVAGITFKGVSGTITYDAQHNPVKSATILSVTADGVKFETVVDP